MALIGDIIYSVRSKIPDMPPTLPAPTAIATVVAVAGSTLPAGVYYGVVTQRNPWGETATSAEFGPLTIAANQGLQIGSILLPSATVNRIYLTLAGGVAGSEIQFVESATAVTTISTSLTGYGTPPSLPSAFLLDSDGPMFSAATLYSWLNEGLAEFSRIVGGILDYSGVPTVAGQPLYVTPAEWLEISDVWYNGYWVQGGKRAEFFRRNAVTTSVLARVTVSVMTNQQVLEVNPQPDRTAGTTTTTAAMLTNSDTSIAIANGGFSYLPFGFAQLSGPLGTEIVAFSSLVNGFMSGLIRALGSTVGQVWPSGTTVTELSLFWCGKRLFATKYNPGQAGTTLQAPHGWFSILPLWMLAQAKRAEQDVKQAMEMEEQFAKSAQAWYLSNKGVTRFVQVSGGASGSGMLTFDNTIAGGIIIPGP